MTSLMDPLTDDQAALIDIVWTVFHEHSRFPHFFYVDYMMREQGRDAAQTLLSFPAVGQHLVEYGYRAVRWVSRGPNPEPDAPVHLTAAGLYHVNLSADAEHRADDLVYGLLAFMSEITTRQQMIIQSPFDKPHLGVNAKEVPVLSNRDGGFFNRLAQIAGAEWPGINYLSSRSTGYAGKLRRADFARLDDYLNAVTTELAMPEAPPKAMTVSDPRSLLRALNHLDMTTELILRRAVVARPALDRSSALALDVDDQDGYLNGLAVLADLFRDLNVPGSNPSNGHSRLPAYLSTELPKIDEEAVEKAVRLLDQIRVLRNNVVHPKPSPNVQAAHRALGLTWPVRDYGAAWNSVRGSAEKAVNALQEAIQGARP